MVSSGLRLFTEKTDDGQPAIDTNNGEELMHVQECVGIVLGSHPSESSGTLFITSKQVIWLSTVDRSKGYSVDFLSISLHAVCRDPEAYPSPCIYAQIDIEEDEDESEGSDSEGHTAGPLVLSSITEIRLVPSNPTQLDKLFEVFCECAELNPGPINMEEEEEEEEHEWIFSADQLRADEIDGEESEWNSESQTNSIGHINGDHDLPHTVLQLQINDHRFEDAEETGDANGRHH